MSNFNKEKIITLLNEASKALEILREYKNYDRKKLLANYKDMSVVKYHFIILIEASIDICNHISSKKYKQVADSYSHCFSILAENNFIEQELGDKLSLFAKFRNVLVHLYWKVDDSIVVAKLEELFVFEEYFSKISQIEN